MLPFQKLMNIKKIFCFEWTIINKRFTTQTFNAFFLIQFFIKFLVTHPKQNEQRNIGTKSCFIHKQKISFITVVIKIWVKKNYLVKLILRYFSGLWMMSMITWVRPSLITKIYFCNFKDILMKYRQNQKSLSF